MYLGKQIIRLTVQGHRHLRSNAGQKIKKEGRKQFPYSCLQKMCRNLRAKCKSNITSLTFSAIIHYCCDCDFWKHKTSGKLSLKSRTLEFWQLAQISYFLPWQNYENGDHVRHLGFHMSKLIFKSWSSARTVHLINKKYFKKHCLTLSMMVKAWPCCQQDRGWHAFESQCPAGLNCRKACAAEATAQM